MGSPKSKKPSTITEDSIDSDSEESLTPIQRPKAKHSSVNINLKRVKRGSMIVQSSDGKTPMNQTESGSLYSDMP